MTSLCIAMGSVLGCKPQASMWVEPNSSAKNLVFGVGTQRYQGDPIILRDIVVVRCDSLRQTGPFEFVWSLQLVDVTTPVITRRIVYGATLSGYHANVKPVSLSSGCYEVVLNTVDGRSAGVKIHIDPRGNIREDPPAK